MASKSEPKLIQRKQIEKQRFLYCTHNNNVILQSLNGIKPKLFGSNLNLNSTIDNIHYRARGNSYIVSIKLQLYGLKPILLVQNYFTCLKTQTFWVKSEPKLYQRKQALQRANTVHNSLIISLKSQEYGLKIRT